MEQSHKTILDRNKMQKLPIIDPVNPGRKYTEKEEKHLREIVKYEFMNIEVPGLMQQFTYGNTNNKMDFKFFHGGEYEIPRFLARHLESKATPIWAWEPDGRGSLRKKKTGTKTRFQMREVY